MVLVLTQTRNRADLLTRSDKSASTSTMDAIRKKMQSLKAETDGLYATIQKFEDSTKEYNLQSDQADCDIRDVVKKAKVFESKCMNNEVTIEEYDKNLRQTTKMT